MPSDRGGARRVFGVCTRYGELGASSRLRFFRYADAWRAAGLEPVFRPFFDDAYLRRLYGGGGRSFLSAATALCRRIASLPKLEDRLYIEYELLPGLPAAWELAALRGRRYVLGFDDRVEMKYAGRRWLEGKYEALIRHAAGTVCANAFLAEWARRFNDRVIEIPTAVDLERCLPGREEEKFPVFTVVWIGTPATLPYLAGHLPALRAMAETVDFELLTIGAELPATAGLRTRSLPWSEATEGVLLGRAHVGIMPLPAEDPFAVGKSAYKLLQYLAAGIPAIASPVGENRRVVVEGETGFLASTPAEWRDALSRIASSPELRRRMGRAARERAAEYSLAGCAPRLTAFLRDCLEG